MNHLPIYYIKPLQENVNSNFSRKFAPDFSIDINKGGFDLHFGVEKPAVDDGNQKLLVLKVGQFHTMTSDPMMVLFDKFFVMKVELDPPLQKLFS